jgi:zinc protease
MSALKDVSSGAQATSSRIQRVVSPGGIEAWLVEEYTVPLIAVDCSFAGGSAQDGPGRSGLGMLLRGLLDSGAGDYNYAAFQEALDEHAVELSFGIENDSFTADLKTLVRHQDKAFELLKLALTQPRFEQADVDRARAQLIAMIKRQSKKPDTLASERWFKLAFGNHPYATKRAGDIAALEALTRDQIAAHARAIMARDNLKISVVGAIDAKTLAGVLDRVFGGLPAKAALGDVAHVAPQGLGRTEVIDLDIPQSTINFGMGGLLRKDDDFIAATVMNHVLGGGSFTSRIWQEVREKRGLAYSVYLNLYPYERTGIFYGGTATKNDRAKEALDVIRDEIAKMAATGPTDEELDKAKRYLIGSYALRFDTSSKIASNLTMLQVEDLGIDYTSRRNGLVEAVGQVDAMRAAARLLGDGKMLVTAAGKPTGF